MKLEIAPRDRLAALLLLTICAIHYVDNPAASFYAKPEQAYAAKAWELILTNAGNVVLLAGVGLLARSWMVWLVLAWGAVEGSERVVCRLARPIGGEPPVIELFTGLCGAQFYWLGIVAASVLAASIAYKNMEAK